MKLRILASVLLSVATSTPAFAQWTWLRPRPQPHTLYDVVFLDDSRAIAVGEAGTILITHDVGQSWTVKTKVNGLASRLLRIDRVDGNTAVVVGAGGVILRTTTKVVHGPRSRAARLRISPMCLSRTDRAEPSSREREYCGRVTED